MYNNSGKSIQQLATLLFWLMFLPFLIAGILVFFALSNSDASISGFIVGLFIVGVGFLIAWLTNLFMHAFGTLVENTASILKTVQDQLQAMAGVSTQLLMLHESIDDFCAGAKKPGRNQESEDSDPAFS